MSTTTVRGLGASPGKVRGRLALSVAEARRLGAQGPVVLVLRDCRSDDARVLTEAAAALVTVRGGVTGHGAIIARALGKPCIVACRFLDPKPGESLVEVHPDGGSRLAFPEGCEVEVDGARGLVTFDPEQP
jgi:pyruvate,orthophosphate dikinase